MRRLTLGSATMKCWRLRSVALVGMLGITSTAWLTARKPTAAPLAEMIRTGRLVAQLKDVPSHNRCYRANLLPVLTDAGQLADWRVVVEAADGERPARPSIVMHSWMPDAPSVIGDRPTVSYLGGGTFRVHGLRFSRPGWWNVSITISDAGVTDSLAFNLIVP